MCAQCMASAVTVAAGASGLRVWLAAASPDWLTPLGLKRLTAVILALAVVLAGVGVG